MQKKKEEMKRVKWFEVNACEEMVGKDVKKNGKIVGKIVGVEPGLVTAELSDKVFKQIYSPVLNCSIGVRVNHDPSNQSKSKSN